MVTELGTGVYPFTAVIQGIKSLHAEDLRSIKLFVLIEAIRKFIDSDSTRFACGICSKEGAITMVEATGNMFTLACTCSNGDMVANLQGLVRWNGKALQESNGRILYRTRDAIGTAMPQEVDDQALKDILAASGGKVVK